MPKTLFETSYAEVSGLATHARKCVTYLSTHRHLVKLPGEVMNLWKTRPLTSTVINEMMVKMMSSSVMDIFATLYIGKSAGAGVPDILTWPAVTLDLKYTPQGEDLSSFIQLKDKVLVNITPYVKETNMALNTTSITDIHSMYVRGLLCRSYAERDMIWLNPSLAVYLMETYSVVMSSVFQSQFRLDVMEQSHIAKLFALYMAQMLSAEHEKGTPDLFYRCTFINDIFRMGGTRVELERFAAEHSDITASGWDLSKICEQFKLMPSGRLKNVDIRTMFTVTSTLCSRDAMYGRIALEYPPYWAMSLIRNISNIQFTSMANHLKLYRLHQRPAEEFLRNILIYQQLYK